MNVLMLGNSLTRGAGLASKIARLADAAVTVHARGGARLAEQLNPATKNGARTAAALVAGGWDFVVLQEMTTAPALTPERYREAVLRLAELARGAGAVPVVYATPAFAPDCPRYERLALTPDELQRALQASFARAASEAGARLANVGAAVWEARDRALFKPDGVHLSEAGADLAAAVIAKALG